MLLCNEHTYILERAFQAFFLRDWWSRKEMFLWDGWGSLKTTNKSWANWLLKVLHSLPNIRRGAIFFESGGLNMTAFIVLCWLWPSFLGPEVAVELQFDPNEIWGPSTLHHMPQQKINRLSNYSPLAHKTYTTFIFYY